MGVQKVYENLEIMLDSKVKSYLRKNSGVLRLPEAFFCSSQNNDRVFTHKTDLLDNTNIVLEYQLPDLQLFLNQNTLKGITGAMPLKKGHLMGHGRYHEPNYCIAWLIGNQEYGKVRSYYNKLVSSGEFKTNIQSYYKDLSKKIVNLNQVPEDISQMKEFFTSLHFNEIVETVDAENDRVLINESNRIITKLNFLVDNDPTCQPLVYIYYSGHGAVDGDSGVWCNSD